MSNMSYTKRHYEKMIDEQVDYWVDAEIQYQQWKEKQITQYEQMLAERDEDYYRELEDEKFQSELNDYWENRHELWLEN